MEIYNKSDSSTARTSAEEGIDLADKLSIEYENMRLLKEEITNCERDIKRNQLPERRKRYSAFRYFWPFLIIAVAVLWVVFFVGFIVLFKTEADVDSVYIAEFVSFIPAGIILTIGGKIARNKREAMNMTLVNEERLISKKIYDHQRRLDELKKMQIEVKNNVSEYNYLVPVPLRNKDAMSIVKTFIESGQAKTFSEAVELCYLQK